MIKDFNTPSCEITPMTMAIIPKLDRNGLSALIVEEDLEYVVDSPPSKIIEAACKFFGVSLQGRKEGARNISGITHKAPISVAPSSGIYFFPTAAPTNHKCSWLSHSHIDRVDKAENNCAEITFTNGRKITLDVSKGSIQNQVNRTAQYRYLLDSRFKYLNRNRTEVVADPSLPNSP
ncbi:competence protein ComK [Virgibacillus natechei]|uniref:Competence protein ComK n=1 Tax=Virgibacillus natechei TaxID=1216297 RepID=A0ABS4IDI2_9BACI|nr:competence protein ComK [Virgibacillus natechei]MBP1969002.1 competence protein ComK [Virgibacillus natechei]UZD14279.1 competence protein ComK [Virgibacillus natechei]